MPLKKLVVFVSDPLYIPAKKFVDLLASSGHFQIETLKRINGAVAFTTLGLVETKDIFSGCEAAFMFVMPADLSQVKKFTHSLLEVTGEAGIRRLAWVAPACPEVSELGNLAEAEHLDKILAEVPTEVQYFNIPQFTALYDLTIGGMNENAAKSWLELLQVVNKYGLRDRHQELARWLGRTSISLSDWAVAYAIDLINVHIIPGRGILTINEGHFEGRPALITRLLQANDRLLIGQRTLDMKAVEIRWADEDITDAEVVYYQPQEGGERVLKLKEGRVISISVRATWQGLRLATQLFFQHLPLPRWQVNLFRQLGLQIEDALMGAADDIVCNCTQTTCGKIQALIESGSNTLEQLADRTQATMICGSCKEFEGNRKLKPNYFYQPDPWKTATTTSAVFSQRSPQK